MPLSTNLSAQQPLRCDGRRRNTTLLDAAGGGLAPRSAASGEPHGRGSQARWMRACCMDAGVGA